MIRTFEWEWTFPYEFPQRVRKEQITIDDNDIKKFLEEDLPYSARDRAAIFFLSHFTMYLGLPDEIQKQEIIDYIYSRIIYLNQKERDKNDSKSKNSRMV